MKKNVALLASLVFVHCFAMDNKLANKKKIVKQDDGSLVYKKKVLVNQQRKVKLKNSDLLTLYTFDEVVTCRDRLMRLDENTYRSKISKYISAESIDRFLRSICKDNVVNGISQLKTEKGILLFINKTKLNAEERVCLKILCENKLIKRNNNINAYIIFYLVRDVVQSFFQIDSGVIMRQEPSESFDVFKKIYGELNWQNKVHSLLKQK